MNVVWGFLVIAVACAVAVASLLFVRRRAPEGGFFEDGDRAAGVFGVLATGFSILLGFIVFLAFESYDQSRTGAEQEALVLVQQVENAQFFPPASRAELTGELVCYGRSVVNGEWDRMRAGTEGDAINPWGVTLFRSLQAVRAEDRDRADRVRQVARPDLGARGGAPGSRPRRVGCDPDQLWIVLFFVAGVIFVFMLFFADRGERAVVQGVLIGSVVAVMAALMLLLNGLDDPFHGGVGGLQPVAMERSLRMIDEALGAIGDQVAAPVRRGREAGGRRDRRRRASRQGGDHRDRAARGRDRRDRLERLPVDQVERRAGEGGRPRQRAADRVGQGGRAREHPDRGRRRDLHAVGQRLRAAPDRACGLLLPALPRGVQARRRRVDRDQAAEEPERAADPVRDAAVQAAGARGRGAARRGSRRLRGPGADEHPARVELRARRRPVRVGAVLRRHEHQADDAEAARRDALPRLRRLLVHRRRGSRPHRSASASEDAL